MIRPDDSESPPRITYYFRKSIQVKNAPRAADRGTLVAQIQYDDGLRMYLNGKEVLRAGLPKGKIEPDTLAASRGNPEQEAEYVSFLLAPTNLREGKNVFAVEVHQTQLSSSDLRFSMILDYVAQK